MKKLILSLAAAFTLLFPAASSAVDVRVHGRYLWSMSFLDHMNIIDPLNREVQGSRFQAYQRLRLWFDMAVSENLTAVLNLEVPRTLQGSLGVGGPGSEVTAREAYLSWKVPNTESRVNMGRFWFHMPSYTFDTPILNEPVDGVMVNIPLGDNYDLNVAWLRPQAETAAWGTAHTSDSSADFGFLSLTAGYENLKVTPWVMGGSIGSHVFKNTVSATPGAQYNPRTPYTSYPRAAMRYGQQEGGWALGFFGDETPASGSTTVWMAGFGAELGMFDPFTIRADFYYGGNDASGGAAREGWYAALGADLKTSGWGRPFIRGWYASGDDGGTKKSGRAPVFEGQGYFNAASGFFYDNTLLCPTIINRNPNGTWGVQFGVKDLALFSPKITHQLSATWIRGNNSVTRAHYRAPEGSPKKFAMAWEDSPVGYMTTADSALVLDFITEWRLYRNLSFAPLISYIISDFDTSENRWGSKYDANGFRCTLSFNYAF